MLFVTRHFKPVCNISVLVYLSNCNLLMQYSSVCFKYQVVYLYVRLISWEFIWDKYMIVRNTHCRYKRSKGGRGTLPRVLFVWHPPPSTFPMMVAPSKLFSKNDATSPTRSFLRYGLNLVTVPELSFTDNKRKPWKGCLRRVALKKNIKRAVKLV